MLQAFISIKIMFHIYENGINDGYKFKTLYVDPGDRPETPADAEDR